MSNLDIPWEQGTQKSVLLMGGFAESSSSTVNSYFSGRAVPAGLWPASQQAGFGGDHTRCD